MDRIPILSPDNRRRRGDDRTPAQKRGHIRQAEALLARNGGVSTNPRQTIKMTTMIDLARERDNYICQDCNITQDQYLAQQKAAGKKLITQLDVHHLYPTKDFQEYIYDLDKVTTLCCDCHSKAERLLRRDKKNKTGIYLNYRRKLLR